MKTEATIWRATQLASADIEDLKRKGNFQAECDALGIPKEPPGQLWRVNREGILWFRQFVKHGGLVLAPKYWILENDAVGAVSAAIESAFVNGSDSIKAAAKFIYEGAANDVIQTQIDPDDYEAIYLLFRSLINRGHGNAYMIGAETTPGFGGFRYILSPRHPEPDICDLLVEQNLFGLGKGVYPSVALCPWPAHPGTLSYVEIVFADEVTQEDNDGKETSLQALARLSPSVRVGVLGLTKAKYFDQGLLKSWMIRSPLDQVQERLVKLGLLDGNCLEKDPDPDEYGNDDE